MAPLHLPYISPTSALDLPTSPLQVLGSLGSILIIWLAAGVLLYEGASRIVMTLIAGHAMVTVDGGAMAPSPTPN